MAPNVASARNLNKNQLGGVIFGCTNSTMKECLTNQLFGLPSVHFSYVRNISPGLALFLFNYSDRKLHGVYEAASSGKMCIDRYAWSGDGSDRTKYPAQVQTCLRIQCQPLTEVQFKPIIVDNYYNQAHFWFELDHSQAGKLIYEFYLSVAPRPYIPRNPPNQTGIREWLPMKKKTEGASQPRPLPDDLASSHDRTGTITTLEDPLLSNGIDQLMGKSLGNRIPESDEKDLDLAVNSQFSAAHVIGYSVEATLTSDLESGHEAHVDDLVILKQKNVKNSFDSLNCPDIVVQVSREIEELKAFKQEQTERVKSLEKKLGIFHSLVSNWNFSIVDSYPNLELSTDISSIGLLYREIEELKAFKQEQTERVESLEKKLAVAELEIHGLQNRCMAWKCMSCTSTELSGEKKVAEIHDKWHTNVNDSILIVGGYDGKLWLSALDSFLPARDELRSHKPMSSARSSASVARFNEELYVIGGGTSSMWYKTVESYNTVRNEWAPRPSLIKEKSNLGGAVLNGKIFAVGGGNGVECFSDVEMFDPYIGRWISTRSMLQKRFGVATMDLNGALYAVGGFDGNDYLKSGERFDPREHSWTKIGSMNTERGCHSLVALNEKLYAIGGCNGMSTLANVEIYDPRVGKWVAGQDLNEDRAHLAAVVIRDSIYVIGGSKVDGNIVEKIECYRGEDEGWQVTNLMAVGKRSFASAIVMEWE